MGGKSSKSQAVQVSTKKDFSEQPQIDTTTQHLFDAFKSNNSDDALKIIKFIKSGVITYNPETTFKGSLDISQPIINYRPDGDQYYYRNTRTKLFSYVEALLEAINVEISNYIKKDQLYVQNVKPVWLAYIFIIYDQVTAKLIYEKVNSSKTKTNWQTVFTELAEISDCKVNDTIFGSTILDILCNEIVVSNSSYESNNIFYCVQGAKFPVYLHAFHKIIKNSQIDVKSCDIISVFLNKDKYEFLKDFLEFTGAINLINSRLYLHLLENMPSSSNKEKYIELLVKYGQDLFAQDADGKYCFQLAVEKNNRLSFMYYFKNFNIIKHFDTVLSFLLTTYQSDKDTLSCIIKQAVETKHDIFTKKYKGTYPLHIACAMKSQPPIILEIYNAATTLNLPVMQLVDEKGRTPLHIMCENADKTILDLNVFPAIDIADNQGNTILHLLASNINSYTYLILDRLIMVAKQKGINIVNSKNFDGQTVVHILASNTTKAQSEYTIATIGKLHSIGADLLVKNKKEQTVIDIAFKKKNYDLVDKITELTKQQQPKKKNIPPNIL